MSKILYKNIEGIKSNYSLKDLGLSALSDGENFKVRQGFIEADLDYLKSSITIPTLLSGWTYEKGIYAIITNDPLAENPIAAKYEVLFLVAKKTSNYQRQFYYSVNNGINWYVLQSDGTAGTNYPSICTKASLVSIGSEFLIPENDGEIKFINDYGVLKIYLPHDCFWFGHIERNIKLSDTTSEINGFYFDRLSEPTIFDNLNQPLGGISLKVCPEGRRLGVEYEITKTSTTSTIISGNAAKFKEIETADDGAKLFACINQESGELLGLPAGYFIYTYNGTTDLKIRTWIFPTYNNGTEILVPNTSDLIGDGSATYADALLKTSITYTKINNPVISWGDLSGYLSGSFFRIPIDDFIETEFIIQDGTTTIEDSGFVANTAIEGIIITAVLDKKTEIIIAYDNSFYTYSGNFALKISNLVLPNNINVRITDLKFYVKRTTELDFELFKTFDLLDKYCPSFEEFYLSEWIATGIYLSQNIGFLVDLKNLDNYEVITAFKDILIENGISTVITNNDYINVYGCTVGGGKVMQDLFYKSNIINLPGVSYVQALLGLNGKIGILTNKLLHIVNIDSVNGSLIYEIIDNMNLGIDRITKIVNTKTGSIILDNENLYFLDGYKKVNLGADIQNLIIQYNSTAELYYNAKMNEVYFIPTPNYGYHYRIRLNQMAWEKKTLSYWVSSVDITYDRFEDYNGKICYLTNKGFYTETDTNPNSEITLISGYENFGKESNPKIIDSITLEYIGKLDIVIIFYIERYIVSTQKYELFSEQLSFTLEEHLTQRKELVKIPLNKKYRIDYMQIAYQSESSNFKLYSLEVDAELLP